MYKVMVSDESNALFVVAQHSSYIENTEDENRVKDSIAKNNIRKEHANPLENVFHVTGIVCIYEGRPDSAMMLFVIDVKSRHVQDEMRDVKPYIIGQNGEKNRNHSTTWERPKIRGHLREPPCL